MTTSVPSSGTTTSQPEGDWRRPTPDAAALRRDLVVGVVLVLVALATWEVGRSSRLLDDATTSDLEQAAWSVAAALPLTVRRRFPVAVMLVCAGVFLAMGVRDPVLSVQFSIQVFLFVALFTAAA